MSRAWLSCMCLYSCGGGDDPASPIDGTWSGACLGDVVLTETQQLDVTGDLVLEEGPPGTVTGTFPFTTTYATTTVGTGTYTYQGIYVLEGTLTGTDLHLALVGYTSTISSPRTDNATWFDLVLAGDELDGDFVFQDDAGGEHPVPCEFTRSP